MLSVVVLFTLWGCQTDSISDTYWRNNQTGEWLIGFTEGKVVYDCKVWDIISQTDKEDAYTILAENNGERLVVKMEPDVDGKRMVSIGDVKAECSFIDEKFLPDYPEKDTLATFADNHYREGDSVTIVGWILSKSDIVNWLREHVAEDGGNKDEAVVQTTNIFTDQQETFTTPIDAEGHFTLRMPIINTTPLYIKIGNRTTMLVAEPNETYFMLIDPAEDKKLFMGKNARLQNEINAHYISSHGYGSRELEAMGGVMNILDNITKQTKSKMQELDNMCKEHPTLSERYRAYFRQTFLIDNAHALMQGMYLVPDFALPEEYIKTVDEDYWKEFAEPYTLTDYRFSYFMRDCGAYLQMHVQDKLDHTMMSILSAAEKDGFFKLSAKDKEAIRRYDEAYPAYNEKRKNAPDSLRKEIEDEFGENDFVKAVLEIQSRNPEYEDYSLEKFTLNELKQIIQELDALGWSETAKDIHLCRYLIQQLDWSRKPLSADLLALADEHIHLPLARKVLQAKNDSYVNIGQRTLTHADNLKSNEALADMSDGEKIFRKIIEPNKGKIILLDVWGTWCSPCKQRLSHSQEEYERLKDFDIVYLYLANNSSDESWKNVIKEYRVEGDNVVHYNLPKAQQTAIEHYLGVTYFPTYKLIDRNGTILNVNADPQNLDALAELLKRMK